MLRDGKAAVSVQYGRGQKRKGHVLELYLDVIADDALKGVIQGDPGEYQEEQDGAKRGDQNPPSQ